MTSQELLKAEKHIRNAWVAGIVSTTTTLIYALYVTFTDEFLFSYASDEWTFIDVILLAGLTYGIYRKSRYSALIMLIYFVLSKLFMVLDGQLSGGVMGILFLYFYFMGTLSAFRLHKHKVESGEIVKKAGKRGFLFYTAATLGGLTVLILAFFLVVGAMSPPIEVIPGRQVKKEYISYAREQGLLEDTEKMHYWYSDGFGDFKQGFYFFTDSKVVVYSQDWEEPALKIPYTMIQDIMFEQDSSFMEDSRITLYLNDDTLIYFPVSSEKEGDVKYYEKLLEVWQSATASADTNY